MSVERTGSESSHPIDDMAAIHSIEVPARESSPTAKVDHDHDARAQERPKMVMSAGILGLARQALLGEALAESVAQQVLAGADPSLSEPRLEPGLDRLAPHAQRQQAFGKLAELLSQFRPSVRELVQAAVEKHKAQLRTDALAQGATEVLAAYQTGQEFQGTVQRLATENPEQFKTIMRQAFGGKLNDVQLNHLLEQAKAGEMPVPPNVRFVDPSDIQGANAAYSSADGGTMFLSRDLIDDPEALLSAFTEEAGHHVDQLLGGPDSQGDEGAIFQQGIERGEGLGAGELLAQRLDRDQGIAVIDGEVHGVEYQGSIGTPARVGLDRVGGSSVDFPAPPDDAQNFALGDRTDRPDSDVENLALQSRDLRVDARPIEVTIGGNTVPAEEVRWIHAHLNGVKTGWDDVKRRPEIKVDDSGTFLEERSDRYELARDILKRRGIDMKPDKFLQLVGHLHEQRYVDSSHGRAGELWSVTLTSNDLTAFRAGRPFNAHVDTYTPRPTADASLRATNVVEKLRSKLPEMPEGVASIVRDIAANPPEGPQTQHVEDENGHDWVVWTDGERVQAYRYYSDDPGDYPDSGEADFWSTSHTGMVAYEAFNGHNQVMAYLVEELGYPPNEAQEYLQQIDQNTGQRMVWSLAKVRGDLFDLPRPEQHLGPNPYAGGLSKAQRNRAWERAQEAFPTIDRGEREDAGPTRYEGSGERRAY